MIGLLVQLDSIHYWTYICCLSTKWSTWILISCEMEIYLGWGFALRCFQRLSRPNIATQHCSWWNNWHTSGPFLLVLSYWKGLSSNFLRAQQIETELSHACNSIITNGIDYIFFLCNTTIAGGGGVWWHPPTGRKPSHLIALAKQFWISRYGEWDYFVEEKLWQFYW